MKITIYQETQNWEDSLEYFRELHYCSQLKWFASDLLEKGLTPAAINEAVRRAMRIAKTANLEVREHFYPLYTEYRGNLVRDCKLSELAYGLVLLNAEPDNQEVAKWQISLLERVLKLNFS